MNLNQWPVFLLKKCKNFGFLPFIIITAFALCLLFRLDIQSSFMKSLPDDNPIMKTTGEINSKFASSDFIIASIDSDPSNSTETMRKVDALSEEFAKLPDLAGVVSATTVKDMVVSNDEIAFVPIFKRDSNTDSADQLLKKITDTELFRKFLVSNESKAFI